MKLSLLTKLAIPGIYALQNNDDKLVAVFYARNIARSIANLAADLAEGSISLPITRDSHKLRIRLVETWKDEIGPEYGMWQRKLVIDQFKASGWKLYNHVPCVKYKLDSIETNGKHLVVVKSDKKTLGIFAEVESAYQASVIMSGPKEQLILGWLKEHCEIR